INSVIRAMRLVEILTERGKPTVLKDVAGAVGLNKVTTHRLLRSLCQSGVVQTIGDNGHYALGPAVLTFAEGFRKSFTMRDRVLPYLERLAKLTKETAIYCERYGHVSCVTIETWDSPHDTRTFSGTGVVRPLTAGSSALAILAMLPERDILSVIGSKKLVQHTSFAPSTRKQLLDKLKEIKKLGYAVSMRERDLDTGGIAAPVFDDQKVIGSLAVIGPVDRMERNGIQRIGRQVQMIASELSAELASSTRFVSGELRKAAR
ncbi:MAG: IclR family transcriptional regulator, partial [Gammaproteobacteria bacterium]